MPIPGRLLTAPPIQRLLLPFSPFFADGHGRWRMLSIDDDEFVPRIKCQYSETQLCGQDAMRAIFARCLEKTALSIKKI
jgi:hypothetical protein